MRHSRVFPARLAISAAALVALGACGDASPFPTAVAHGAPVGGVDSLTVNPTSAVIAVNQNTTLATNRDTAALDWTSSLPAVAAVSATGIVTGLSAGTATITVRVRSDTTQRAQATVTVTGSTGGTSGTP